MEWYLQPALVSKAHWEEQIASLRAAVDEAAEQPLPLLQEQWLAAFERAVLARAKEHERIGVLFSGGVDSSFIAFILHKRKIPFTCYTIGFQDERTKAPDDIFEARKVAAHYAWRHRDRILSVAELEPFVEQTARILGDAANPTSVGVGTVVVAAAHLAAQDGITVLFGGLGSEEIFAGYQRHEKAVGVHEECWNGLVKMYDRDLVRDARIGAALGITVPTPFLDHEVMRIAMLLPESMKIKDEHKKYIFRIMAQDAGLVAEFAFRPKRAAQYGSRIQKAIYKLARDHGFPDEERYLESICGFPVAAREHA